jgi:Flp pilus assembly protein TadG
MDAATNAKGAAAAHNGSFVAVAYAQAQGRDRMHTLQRADDDRSASRTADSEGRRFIGHLISDRAGAAAVEFALVSIPFFALLFVILELALVFLLSVSLSNATANEARKIRVGGLEAAGVSVMTSSGNQLDVPAFKAAICSQIVLVPTSTCTSQLQVDIRTLNSFEQSAPPSPISGSTFNTGSLCFYSGAAGSIVQVRAYYLWSLLDPILLAPLANITQLAGSNGASTTGTWLLISSTEVLKTEAVPGETNTGAGC